MSRISPCSARPWRVMVAIRTRPSAAVQAKVISFLACMPLKQRLTEALSIPSTCDTSWAVIDV